MTASAYKLNKPLSKEEIAKLIRQYVGKNFDIYGERFDILSKVVEYVDRIDHAMTSVEVGGNIVTTAISEYLPEEQAAIWLPRVASILESSAFVAVSEILTVSTALIFPFGAVVELIKANYTAERVYGMRAVAYTTTAWAFDDPMPHNSPSRLHDLRLNFSGNRKLYMENLNAYRKAWNNAQRMTLSRLTQIGKKDKQAGQIMFRAIGDGNRQKLAEHILKGFKEEARGVDKVVIRVAMKLDYPN